MIRVQHADWRETSSLQELSFDEIERNVTLLSFNMFDASFIVLYRLWGLNGAYKNECLKRKRCFLSPWWLLGCCQVRDLRLVITATVNTHVCFVNGKFQQWKLFLVLQTAFRFSLKVIVSTQCRSLSGIKFVVKVEKKGQKWDKGFRFSLTHTHTQTRAFFKSGDSCFSVWGLIMAQWVHV